MGREFFFGLDLGQAQDYTALAVLQQLRTAKEPDYLVRYLQRFPLDTPYTAIGPSVARLASAPGLPGNAILVVDQTGVGRPVVELFLRQPGLPPVVPITITAGQQVTMTEDRSLHVPKKELVRCLQRVLERRRLKIARGLPDALALTQELLNFRVTITASANETFGAGRRGEHDDLVLALALACWLAENVARLESRASGVRAASAASSDSQGAHPT